MRLLFWNIRGLGNARRRRQLRELVFEQKVEIICLQETIKDSLTDKELKDLLGGHFSWRYVAAKGHSGGMMTGVKDILYEWVQWDQGEFSLKAVLRNKKDGFTWELINVYGPAQQTNRDIFLSEIGRRVDEGVYPMLIGGDFNLYRFCSEKSNGVCDIKRMEAFNNFIAIHELQELFRLGERFTWTNKQLNPVRSVLDRVFATRRWEQKNPLTIVSSLLRVGSDHCPILLDTREEERMKGNIFRIEMGWFEKEGFKESLLEKWPKRFQLGVLDYWHFLMPFLRRWMRGWASNFNSQVKKERKDLE